HPVVFFHDPAPPQLYPLSYTTLFRSTFRSRWGAGSRRAALSRVTLSQRCVPVGLRGGAVVVRLAGGAGRLGVGLGAGRGLGLGLDRKSTRLNSSHDQISYAVFCLKK